MNTSAHLIVFLISTIESFSYSVNENNGKLTTAANIHIKRSI